MNFEKKKQDYIRIRDFVKEEFSEPDLSRTWYRIKPSLIAFWEKVNNFKMMHNYEYKPIENNKPVNKKPTP